MLEEVKLMHNIPHSNKVLLAGFGMGAKFAFFLAAFYPDQFGGVAMISQGPFGDSFLESFISARLSGPLKDQKLPSLLLVHGEEDGVVSLLETKRQAAQFEQAGFRADIKNIPGMGHKHMPSANPIILDWFENGKA